ncbi:MAG: cytochrome c family protein [Pseudomonadota bacterium]
MFDTMTLTKAAGAFLSAWLVLLLGGWVASELYSVGHHGGDHHQAYSVEIDTGEEPAEAEPDVPFEERFASADAGRGERVWSKCRACHKLEAGENATGPYLHGIVGRDVGAADGFNYSGALSDAADVWTPEALYAFLEDPKGYAPGTSMAFVGLDSSDDRVNLIAYLETFE